MKLILIWIAISGSTISNINSTACYKIYKSDNIMTAINIFVTEFSISYIPPQYPNNLLSYYKKYDKIYSKYFNQIFCITKNLKYLNFYALRLINRCFDSKFSKICNK